MPTLVPTHGKLASVELNATDASPWLNTFQYVWQADTAETTAFGATAKSFITGFPGGSATLSGPLDITQNTGGEAIINGILAGTTPAVLSIIPGGASIQGNRCFVACMYCNNEQIDTTYTDVVKFSTTWSYAFRMGGGKVCQNNVPVAGASFNQTGNTQYKGTSTDFTAATTFGGVANLHVLANTLNQTCAIKLQHDTAVGLGTAADVTGGAFTTLPATTVGQQSLQIAPTNINQYIGVVATAGAASPTGSITFVVTFAKYTY